MHYAGSLTCICLWSYFSGKLNLELLIVFIFILHRICYAGSIQKTMSHDIWSWIQQSQWASYTYVCNNGKWLRKIMMQSYIHLGWWVSFCIAKCKESTVYIQEWEPSDIVKIRDLKIKLTYFLISAKGERA